MAPRCSGRYASIAPLCHEDAHDVADGEISLELTDLATEGEIKHVFAYKLKLTGPNGRNGRSHGQGIEHEHMEVRAQLAPHYLPKASRGYLDAELVEKAVSAHLDAPRKASPLRESTACYPTIPPLPSLPRRKVEGGDSKEDILRSSASAAVRKCPPFMEVSTGLSSLPPTSDLLPHDCKPLHATTSCPYSQDYAHDFVKPVSSQSNSARKSQTRHSNTGGLFGALLPGDVLNIIGETNAITRLGAAGGFMGHVLLVLSPPQPISKRSAVGRALHPFLPKNCKELYSVGTVECSRSTEGLYQVNVVVCLDEVGRVSLCGEYWGDEVTINEGLEEVHMWHSPSGFRGDNFSMDVMSEVLEDMRSCQQNWSWSTAVRAFLFSGDISANRGAVSMKEIEESWQAQPICTSIVVTFWQRYFCKLARLHGTDPLNLILQHMPLRSDRVLPGELLSTMLSRGWSLWEGPSHSSAVANRSRAGTI